MELDEAIEVLKDFAKQVKVKSDGAYQTDKGMCACMLAIKALEKQEKIKEAFEKWKTETGGYYGADDETTRFIRTLSQILRSDEE